MRLIRTSAVIMTLVASAASFGQDPKEPHEPRPFNAVEVLPKGDFGKIDTHSTTDLMKRLSSSDRSTKTKAIQQVKASPGKVAPPALYSMSNEMFRLGQKDDAVFWFYL